MKSVFRSDFIEKDTRWQTRHTYPNNVAADRCARVYNGKLQLRIKSDPDHGFVMAHVGTQNSFQFTYGIAEARMRFHGPVGSHSAFWLQTTEDYIPGQAEIDIVEHFGRNSLWHNVYWREQGQMIGEFKADKIPTKVVDPYQWHIYGCEWWPDKYIFTIDREKVAESTQGLSDRPKMVVLSNLVADWEEKNLQLDNLKNQRTEVDWVNIKQ